MRGRVQGYNIPSLTIKEIVQYLRENEFNVVESDILLPSSSYVCKLYEGILSVFAEEKVEKYSDESLLIIHTYYLMREFMQKTGFLNLQLKDVTHPESARIIKILSAVINFALFKETKNHIYTEIYKKRKEIENTIESTEQEIKEKTELLRRRMQEKDSTQKEIKEIEKEIQKQEKEIIDFHRVKQRILTEVEEVKKDLSNVTKIIGADKVQIIEVAQDISRLQTQIVKNPEQLKELLIGMKMQLKGEDSILHEYEKKIAHLHKNIAYFKEAAEDIKSLICTVSLAEEYGERLHNGESHLKQLIHENENLEIENKSKIAEKGMLEKKIVYIVDKMNSLNEEDSERLKNAKKEFEALRKKHNTIIRERGSMQSMIQKNNQEIKQLEKEIIETESQHESCLSSMYTDLLQKKSFLLGYAEDMEKVVKGEYIS